MEDDEDSSPPKTLVTYQNGKMIMKSSSGEDGTVGGARKETSPELKGGSTAIMMNAFVVCFLPCSGKLRMNQWQGGDRWMVQD